MQWTSVVSDDMQAAAVQRATELGHTHMHTVVYWGYTRVYGVYQPPGFLTAYTHLIDHRLRIHTSIFSNTPLHACRNEPPFLMCY